MPHMFATLTPCAAPPRATLVLSVLSAALIGISINTGAQAQQPRATLDTIRVQADNTEEYKAENTRSLTFTDTPLKEIPQSISVISRGVLDDLGETIGIDNSLELGGVGKGSNYAGSMGSYTLRGFSGGSYYRNGMNQGSNSASAPDVSGVESLDVMRGPSSVTLGAGDPGGTFNIVSKQPLEHAAYDFGLTFDTEGGRRGTADLTGPINTSGTLLYRVNMALNDSKTFRDHTHINREYVAPRFTLKVAPQTRVLLDIEWLRARAPLERGIPINNGLLFGPPSYQFFTGEPAARRLTSETLTGQLRLEHEFSDNWSIDLGVQRTTGKLRGDSIEINNIIGGRTARRYLMFRINEWSSSLAQGFLKGKFNALGMEHQVLMGLEYRNGYSGLKHWRSDVNAFPMLLDIYNPVYTNFLPPLNPRREEGTRTHNRAVILQDQMRVTPRINVLAGLRYESFDNRFNNYFTRAVTPTNNKALTPRVGGSYRFSDTVTGYLSHARSFKPTTTLDINGNTLKPERGQSWEMGLKTDLFDKRLQVTTALFHIVKQNVSTADPTDNNFRIAAGEVRSRGVDIDVSGKIGPRTKLAGYMGWVDAEITKDTNALLPGARVSNVPHYRTRLLALHELGGALRGVEVGAGWQYVGDRVTSSTATALHLPSYSVVDLMVNYQVNANAKLRFSLKNAFDRRYFERNFGNNAVPGDPRTFYATLEYRL